MNKLCQDRDLVSNLITDICALIGGAQDLLVKIMWKIISVHKQRLSGLWNSAFLVVKITDSTLKLSSPIISSHEMFSEVWCLSKKDIKPAFSSCSKAPRIIYDNILKWVLINLKKVAGKL